MENGEKTMMQLINEKIDLLNKEIDNHNTLQEEILNKAEKNGNLETDDFSNLFGSYQKNLDIQADFINFLLDCINKIVDENIIICTLIKNLLLSEVEIDSDK